MSQKNRKGKNKFLIAINDEPLDGKYMYVPDRIHKKALKMFRINDKFKALCIFHYRIYYN